MTVNYFKSRNGYEIEGQWYPRVTSICNIIAKPGLERWLANQRSFAAMQRKRKKITDWGSLIHDTVEKILIGKTPRIDPSIRPSIEAFFDWINNNKVKAFEIEKRVLSKKHNYTGTFDILAEVNGKLGIIDVKTSAEIWDDFFIQIAAYFQAYNEKTPKKAKTYWVLRVDQFKECELCGAKKRDKNGELNIKGAKRNCNHQWTGFKGVCDLEKVNDHGVYIDAFLAAKNLWEFSNRHHLSQIKEYSHKFKQPLTLWQDI